MPRPKKHRFIVEVTDMELEYSENRIRGIVNDALDRGLCEHGYSGSFLNIQVKSLNRVMQAQRWKWRWTPK